MEVTGKGAEARISIAFTAYGEKQFALSIAPIAKMKIIMDMQALVDRLNETATAYSYMINLSFR